MNYPEAIVQRSTTGPCTVRYRTVSGLSARAGSPQSTIPDPGRILILGLGNPLCGDDGLGARAAEMLSKKHLPDSVEVRQAGTPGWELPLLLEGWPRVILIDAVEMGLMPGARRRFNPEEVRLIATGKFFSVHEPDLATGLALAEALDLLPEELVVFGVEPESCEPGTKLNQKTEQALDGLVEDILNEVNKSTEKNSLS
jgi:hydrogenase maturation protease